MSEQQSLFSKNTIQNINQYFQAAKAESKTDGDQVKLAPSSKIALTNICNEHGFKKSEFLRDAIDTHIILFPFKDKIQKHKDLIITMLSSLR